MNIRGEQTGTDGNKWYQIQFTGSDGAVKTGCVSSVYIKIPINYTTDSDFEAYLNSQGFQRVIKKACANCTPSIPTRCFRSLQTQLDWNTVIENESLPPRNLVNSGSISSWKSVANGAYNWGQQQWTGFDGSNWVAASDEIIRYYMDPRNFLDETYIFQFLSQEYNGNTQTRQGLETLVKDSFLSERRIPRAPAAAIQAAPEVSGDNRPGARAGDRGRRSSPVRRQPERAGRCGREFQPGRSPPQAEIPFKQRIVGGEVSVRAPGLRFARQQCRGDTVAFEAPGAERLRHPGAGACGQGGFPNVACGTVPGRRFLQSGGGQSPRGRIFSVRRAERGSPSSGPSASTSGPAHRPPGWHRQWFFRHGPMWTLSARPASSRGQPLCFWRL